MSRKKINTRGFAHYVAPLAVVVGFAIAGVAYLVASHADTLTNCSPGISPRIVAGQCESLVGQVTPSQSNETITAYACVTKLTNTEWVTNGLFELSSSFKQPVGFNWTASIINGGTTTLPNNQAIYQNFIDDATTPAADITMFTNPYGQNPLSFSYEAGYAVKGGTTLMGNIAQGIHPVNLVNC